MKAVVDRSRCAGHARCQALAPAVFDTDPVEGKVIVRHEKIPPELLDLARRGARGCPERAITLEDDNGEVVRESYN